MDRARTTGAVLLTLGLLGACRPGDVRIAPEPQIGDRARYRYEIAATVTRSLDGQPPVSSNIATTLIVDQTVTRVTGRGVEADVILRRDGGNPRAATVVLDPTGAIRDVETVTGLAGDGGGDAGDAAGLSELGALLPASLVPPTRRLAPGDRWRISVGPIHGQGRLERFAIEHDTSVAIVRSRIEQEIKESVASGSNVADLAGVLRSTITAAYALSDGSVRRTAAHATGSVRARVQPPPGVSSPPKLGTITYDIEVRATRLR